MWFFGFVFSFWLFGLFGFVPFLLLWLCEPVECWWRVPLFGSFGPCRLVVRSRRCRFRVLWRRLCWSFALWRVVRRWSFPHRREPSFWSSWCFWFLLFECFVLLCFCLVGRFLVKLTIS